LGEIGFGEFGVLIADLDGGRLFERTALLTGRVGSFGRAFGSTLLATFLAGFTFTTAAGLAGVTLVTFGNGGRGAGLPALSTAAAHYGREAGNLRSARELRTAAAGLLTAVPAGTLSTAPLLLAGTLLVLGGRRGLSAGIFELGHLRLFGAFLFRIIGTVKDAGIGDLGRATRVA
jgi:hypothetical protein